MPINNPREDRYPGDGWGGPESGTRRIDDCIDEVSFGPESDSDDENRVSER